MQLAPVRTLQPLNPELARRMVAAVGTEIDRLDTKLHHEAKLNRPVSREWPRDLEWLANGLVYTGTYLTRMGADAAAAGASLIAASKDVRAFTTTMTDAYAKHTVLGPQTAAWLDKFTTASNAVHDAKTALALVDGSH